MGPGVLAAMQLRRILILSGHREPEETAEDEAATEPEGA